MPIARIASKTVGVPTALVSLIDKHRQWFKAKIGFDATEVPRKDTICTYTILGCQAMIVEDAKQDPRFAGNPHVMREGGVRFYAGAPIMDGDGHALGTLCVVDQRPRRITEDQVSVPMALARMSIPKLLARRSRSIGLDKPPESPIPPIYSELS